MIGAYVGTLHKKWGRHLAKFAYAIRTATYDSTGKTPADLLSDRKFLTTFE